jgi:intracellular sulfur oxidation DsrE/DsrF family protein
MWKPFVLSFGLLAGLMPLQPVLGAKDGEEGHSHRSHRVVMHVNSGDEKVQRGVVNNIRHLYQEMGNERLVVEVVVHGAGLSLLIKSATTLGPELTQLHAEYGVAYTACSNTMKAMKVSRDDLISEVGDTVPAMVRLMERQEQGWVYIKP